MVWFVHSAQMHHHAQRLKAEAERAEADGRLTDYLHVLQRYLIFAPDDNAARLRYGETVEQLASSEHERWRAVDIYEQVLYREPSRQDVRLRLVRLVLSLGWMSEARAHLEILLRERPEDGSLLLMLGQCQEDDREYSQAADSYEKAFRAEPHLLEAYVRLALLLKDHLDQPERAEQVLSELVRKNDQSPEAYLARAIQHLQNGRLADSASDMERARTLSQDDPLILLALADLDCRRGRWSEARHWLQLGIRREPRNFALHLALATLERQCQQPRDAIRCLRAGLQALPDQPELVVLLGETLLEVGEESALDHLIEELHRPGVLPGLAHYLRGCLLLHRQQIPQAIHTLAELVEMPSTGPALASRACMVLARCYEQMGDKAQQLSALHQAVVRDKSSVLARMALADALQRGGNLEESLEQYRELVSMGPAPEETWLCLGRLLLQRNRSLPPEKRRWTEISQIMQRAAGYPKLVVPLGVLQAEVLLEQGQTAAARQRLEQLSTDHPDDLASWLGLVDIALRQGDLSRSFQILDNAQAKIGPRYELFAAKIGVALRQTPHRAEQALHALEKERLQLPPVDQVAVLGMLSAAYFQIGQAEDGRRLSRLLAEKAPKNLPSRILLLDLAQRGGDEGLLAELTRELRGQEGESGIWWRYADAVRLLLKTQLSEARQESKNPASLAMIRQFLKELEQRRPGWPRAALLEAYCHEIEGDSARAGDSYLRAFRGGERPDGMAERLVVLLQQHGRFDEADEVIRKCEQKAPLSPPLARLGTEIALRLRSWERAQQLGRLAVPKESDDYLQLLWLGQVLGQAGQPAESEETLRRAVQLRGDVAETWLALIAQLTRFDQDEEAKNVCEEMRRRLPASQLPLALALSSELLARWKQADEQYQQALSEAPNDVVLLQRAANFYVRMYRMDRAEAILRRLLSLEEGTSSESQSWARRHLALLLASTGNEDKYREALTLLPAVEHGEPASFLNERARLLVLAQTPATRPDALRRLEESAKPHPFVAEELFYLVQLLETNGQTELSREKMLDLLALDPRNPTYLTHHLQRLIEQGQFDEARPWLRRLERVDPESPRLRAFQQVTRRGQRSPAKTADH